jgi:hypothetical protein
MQLRCSSLAANSPAAACSYAFGEAGKNNTSLSAEALVVQCHLGTTDEAQSAQQSNSVGDEADAAVDAWSDESTASTSGIASVSPAVSGGDLGYALPVVAAAAELSLAADSMSSFGSFLVRDLAPALGCLLTSSMDGSDDKPKK